MMMKRPGLMTVREKLHSNCTVFRIGEGKSVRIQSAGVITTHTHLPSIHRANTPSGVMRMNEHTHFPLEEDI